MRYGHGFDTFINHWLVWFGPLPGVSNAFLVGHQAGKLWLLEKYGTNETKSLFADEGKEVFNERVPNGLLGLAFHPKFRENRKYYLKHQVFEDGKIATTVVERQAAPDGAKLVRWYENDARGSFTAHDIDATNRQEAYDLNAVDLDGDGRLDLILAGRETRNAVWYRNQKPK